MWFLAILLQNTKEDTSMPALPPALTSLEPKQIILKCTNEIIRIQVFPVRYLNNYVFLLDQPITACNKNFNGNSNIYLKNKLVIADNMHF